MTSRKRFMVPMFFAIIALVVLVVIMGSCAPRPDPTYLGVGAVLGAGPRQPCPPPNTRVNNVCLTPADYALRWRP